MTTLEEVQKLKSQGMSDQDIINNLQQKGISPREINDSLNQAQIKTAVSSENSLGGTPSQPISKNAPTTTPQPAPQSPITSQAPLNPEISQTETPQQPTGGYSQPPSTQEYLPQQSPYAGQQEQENYGQDIYASGGNYGGYDGNYSGGYSGYSGAVSTDTDNMIEIAQQVASEKLKSIQKSIDNLNEFKTLAQVKINHIDERLQKIEKTLDKLQMAILDKISSYGGALNSIKKEMSMVEDSFRKIAPGAVQRHIKTTKKKSSSSKRKTKKTSKKK